MCLAQGPQRSDAGEARTRGPSVSSQALYYWANKWDKMKINTAFVLLLYVSEMFSFFKCTTCEQQRL